MLFEDAAPTPEGVEKFGPLSRLSIFLLLHAFDLNAVGVFKVTEERIPAVSIVFLSKIIYLL